MTAVLRIQHEEPVRLDRSQLEVLYHSLGPVGADKVVAHALEDLTMELARIGDLYRRGDIATLRSSVKAVIALSQQIGMTLLARVGRDVLTLSQSYDATAFGATVARLERIGEGSLVAVWDLQGLSV